MRRRQEAACHVKKCQDIFGGGNQKLLGPSRLIKNTEEVLRSYSRSLQEAIKNDQELKFGTIFVQIHECGTAPRWTTQNSSNYYQELEKNREN